MHRLALLLAFTLSLTAAPPTGPATEKRFPPLKLPKGFKATLFACDPLIEYPSVIARGPRPGTLFVAQDYMSGLGKKIIRRSEVKLIEDTDGDGYADKTTLYAGGFNSLQGLCFHRGQVFAMHAPFLTALRDTNGDGKADQRKNLLSGLGLTPEENPVRLHCANGVEAGHDGWLYLSLGDHGVDVKRPEGDQLVLHGGGILRCRTDGSDLHIFARGLRNIYDVALDADLNVFTRDNENDGGDYKIRWYHSFHGADHGYPYLCFERPKETQQPMADLGLGSSAGGAAYLETHFPKPWRGSLFFCEWGKSVVSYPLENNGSSFATKPEVELAVGDDSDTYPFKATDLIVDYDGTLLVSDWADGQRPKRGRGRIYRIHYGQRPAKLAPLPTAKLPSEKLIALLNNPSHHVRAAAQFALEETSDKSLAALQAYLKKKQLGNLGRLHACWLLPSEDLFKLAETDPSQRVRAQAIRALADRHDPDLAKHKLNAGRGDLKIAQLLAKLAVGQKPIVQREAIIALGRLRYPKTAEWLRDNLKTPDPSLAHAAQQALRSMGNWPAVLRLLDLPNKHPIRPIALRAMAWKSSPVTADELLDRLKTAKTQSRRRDYAGLLTRIYKKPAEWKYWGYRPVPRVPHAVDWKHTKAIASALDAALAEADDTIAASLLRQLRREGVPVEWETLSQIVKRKKNERTVAAALEAFGDFPEAQTRPALEAVLANETYAHVNRLSAIQALLKMKLAPGNWLKLAAKLLDGLVLAAVIAPMGKQQDAASLDFLRGKLKSKSASVKSAVIGALSARADKASAKAIQSLLRDDEPKVRMKVIEAMAALGHRAAADELLEMAGEGPWLQRAACLAVLRQFNDRRAVEDALRGLEQPEIQAVAMAYLARFADAKQATVMAAAARQNPNAVFMDHAIAGLARWIGEKDAQKSLWDLQGGTGQLRLWTVAGPMSREAAEQLRLKWIVEGVSGKTAIGTGLEGRLKLAGKAAAGKGFWLAVSAFAMRGDEPLEFHVRADGRYRAWLNGREIFARKKAATIQAAADRFVARSGAKQRRLVVMVESAQPPRLQARFRRQSDSADHETLTKLALTTRGSTRRGKDLFFRQEKSLCIRCHRMGGQGTEIGPDLTGVGGRFSRIHIIESILQPSRHIANGYQPVIVVMQTDDRFRGMKTGETPEFLEIQVMVDENTRAINMNVEKKFIKQVLPTDISIMPAGLEKLWTRKEFVDLIEYLAAQKKK